MFTFSSGALTDLTKTGQQWKWGPDEQNKFEELKQQLIDATCLGVPMPTGEIVFVTDASDLGGGATIFQWQHLKKIQIPENFLTSGQKDGNLQHNYSEEFRLVPGKLESEVELHPHQV